MLPELCFNGDAARTAHFVKTAAPLLLPTARHLFVGDAKCTDMKGHWPASTLNCSGDSQHPVDLVAVQHPDFHHRTAAEDFVEEEKHMLHRKDRAAIRGLSLMRSEYEAQGFDLHQTRYLPDSFCLHWHATPAAREYSCRWSQSLVPPFSMREQVSFQHSQPAGLRLHWIAWKQLKHATTPRMGAQVREVLAKSCHPSEGMPRRLGDLERPRRRNRRRSQAPAFAPHSFLLDEGLRESGLQHTGSASSFVEKLDRGEPVTVVILGSSVAENGGCVDQPGKRCMAYRGIDPTKMVWGEPRVRPFAGFMVRWFAWLNATWPHPQHRLYNAGRDASSLASIVPCLFSHLPARFDLLLVEAGSMFMNNAAGTVEVLARQIRSMRSPPPLVFLNVHLWCTFGGSVNKKVWSYGITQLPSRVYRFWQQLNASAAGFTVGLHGQARASRSAFTVDPRGRHVGVNPSDTLEDAINALCKHYDGLSCISQRDALMSAFVTARPGFGVHDIAGDCLHPIHGSRGTEYLTDLLVHWTMRAAAAHRDSLANARVAEDHQPLPPPVNTNEDGRTDEKAACFQMLEGVGRSQKSSALPWRTAACPTGGGAFGASAPAASLQAAGCREVDAEWQCPRVYRRPSIAQLPPVWAFCPLSTVFSEEDASKQSPGVVAFDPGATLLLPLPTDWAMRSDRPAPSDAVAQGFNVSLHYVVSWRAMGVVRIGCTGGCACDEHELDAHTTFATRNVTIFTEHRFPVSLRVAPGEARCGVQLTVLDRTSSGGHLFKLRDVLLFTPGANPCERHADMRKFLRSRSNLRCVQKVG